MRAEGPLLDERFAPEAPEALRGELGQGAPLRRGGVDLPGVRPAEELRLRLLLVSHDGAEDAQQRLLQLVLDVVVRVDGEIVLQRVQGVLALLVCLHVLRAGDDDVGHPVAAAGCRGGVALAHPLGELHVRLPGGVVLGVRALAQGLGNHQEREVDPVLQELADDALGVLHGTRDGPIHEDSAQAGLHDLSHQAAVVPAHRLDALGVELVILLGVRPIETRVALLVHQQVGAVDLLELQLDGPDEGLADHLCSLLAQAHRLLDGVRPELDHHGVGVAVDDGRVVRVAILDSVLGLDQVLRVVDHTPAKARCAGGDLQARQHAHRGAGEAVD
mmetsp:Transcript_136285/g.423493  ORF Transcript_136285/g.423493 Transcript_136285/m.423493 type:complete len:331 (+) Transcript_136285:462-1454(+)